MLLMRAARDYPGSSPGHVSSSSYDICILLLI
jgi:hypothetical protein